MSKESRPLSGKGNYDRVGFADRLQNKSICHFVQPIGNWLVPSMLAAGDNRKIALVRFFCENELCNPNCSFIWPAFYSFYLLLFPASSV